MALWSGTRELTRGSERQKYSRFDGCGFFDDVRRGVTGGAERAGSRPLRRSWNAFTAASVTLNCGRLDRLDATLDGPVRE